MRKYNKGLGEEAKVCLRGEEKRMEKEKMRERQGEVNRRRGRCSCLSCLCANNYPDEIHRERHEMQRKRS